MSLTRAQIHSLADELRAAARTRVPVAPLSARVPGLTAADAYAIQLENIRERRAAGAVIRGHKVGLTSRAMQEMLGVREPDYGHLLDDMLLADGSTVPIERFVQPRVEVEIAFRLGRTLKGPGVEAGDVLAATDAVAPSIEIIDSRIADWKIGLTDTIADNASSAAVVTGRWILLREAPPLGGIAAELMLDGTLEASGRGADVLGDPARAVAWLANALAAFDTALEAGHVVMPGSCTKAITVRAGSRVEGRFAGLGSVSVTFA
uniref:2-keto-4-pentenoate hydratase n=1 Tax=uncultured bacterium UPO76 TaxID=1776993 RepID=A0A140DZX8_9BACT|nr:2-keto-4-pentenoate hydratase [uncultured bacterium UPO76]